MNLFSKMNVAMINNRNLKYNSKGLVNVNPLIIIALLCAIFYLIFHLKNEKSLE